jgi:hypothetical protein
MNTNLFRWSLAFVTTGIFSIFAVAQQGGLSICGKAAGLSHASTNARDVSSTQTEHAKIGSLPPSTALENGGLNTSLIGALERNGISVPGGDLKAACSGFSNLGQCITALHVAKNLSLSFEDLQRKMTGSNSTSLSRAIQDVGGPSVKAKNEAKKAQKQANRDLNQAEPQA